MQIIKKQLFSYNVQIILIITMKTNQQIKDDFEKAGITISDWSLKHNFSRDLVYRILNTNRLPKRGESRRIAIALGLINEEKET